MNLSQLSLISRGRSLHVRQAATKRRGQQWRSPLVLLALTLLYSSCTSFTETHYFHSVNADSGKPVNYFRITVNGNAGLTRARYVSGYYDERAVDLFFNEIAPGAATTSGDVKPIFVNDQTLPGTTTKVTPLSPQEGVFLMVFSTNAKSVTDTIGQFAENQLVADAMTALVNRDRIKALRAAAAADATFTARAQATAAQLDGIVKALPDDATAPVAKNEALRLLRAIAIALGGDGSFRTTEGAAAWFRSYRTEAR